MKIYILLPLWLIFFTLSGCKDDLPKPTKKGADTFGCKINGKSWVPEGGSNIVYVVPVKAYYRNNNLSISAFTVNKKEGINISFYIENMIGIGEYPINVNAMVPPWATQFTSHGIYKHNDRTYYDSVTGSYGKSTFFATNSNHPGRVTITRFDMDEKIVSGTFEFTAEGWNTSGQTVKITSGRFDTRWN